MLRFAGGWRISRRLEFDREGGGGKAALTFIFY